jgi:hypothetical protein
MKVVYMSNRKSRCLALLLTAILCTGFIPTATASSDPIEHTAFGVEYDWTNLDADFDAMTGLPLDEILADIMESADNAGIDLLILEEITGTSSIIIDQYEDGTESWATPSGSVEMSRHVTELTIRHGGVMDFAMITEWSDAWAGWDITVMQSTVGDFYLDATYIEYRDSNNMIHGFDTSVSASTSQEFEFSIDGSIQGDDSEVLPINIAMDMSVSYEISDTKSSIILSNPSNLQNELAAMGPGDEVGFEMGQLDAYTGEFETAADFEFSLTGLPTEELGMPEGKWDLSVTDGTTDSDTFSSDEMDCELAIWTEEFGAQTITNSDGTTTDVIQARGSPLPMPMTCQIGHLLATAFIGSEDSDNLADVVEEQISELEIFAGQEGPEYDENNGYLDVDVCLGCDDMDYFNVEAWEGIDYGTTYELALLLTDSDGVTVQSNSYTFDNQDYLWDEISFEYPDWGDYCAEVTLTNLSSGNIEQTDTECFTIVEEPEPSQLIIDIAEAFGESTLENALESFGQNLEQRLQDYEATIAYDDGDGFILWDDQADMIVGFQIVVTNEGSNFWWTLIGPDSDSYGSAPIPISATYFSGTEAIAQEAEMDESTTLDDLVDLSEHDNSAINEALGIDEELPDPTDECAVWAYWNPDMVEPTLPSNGCPYYTGASEESGDNTAEGAGILPALSPMMTILVVALAGLVSSVYNRRD